MTVKNNVKLFGKERCSGRACVLAHSNTGPLPTEIPPLRPALRKPSNGPAWRAATQRNPALAVFPAGALFESRDLAPSRGA